MPSLRAGQVMVMDNLSAHKGSRVRELIESRGCELLYLPPYSPGFNPIEEAFVKLKALLRKAGARSREVLIEAMGWALEALTARDARNFFEHRATEYWINCYDRCSRGHERGPVSSRASRYFRFVSLGHRSP